MPPTNASCTQDSTTPYSTHSETGARIDIACAIHQPNLFPRLSTLAKLHAAQVRIVLDDVQFCRRDYQHRAWLAPLADPHRGQWLSIPTHLPHGQQTLINEAKIADPTLTRRRILLLTEQYYRRAPHWPAVRDVVQSVLTALEHTNRTSDIAEASTTALLTALDWPGQTYYSSDMPCGTGRSQRLADLAILVGATTYLCGTGGMRYLEREHFDTRNLQVVPFRTPDDGIWFGARKASSLRALALLGPDALRLNN